MIQLTDEEIKQAIEARFPFMYPQEEEVCRLTAKAQLKKVVEWRNEECTEHDHTINISGFDHKVLVIHNDCEECWQALLEEAK